MSPNVFKFCVSIILECSNLYLVFINEKGELTILTTKHSLLARQPIMAKKNLLSDMYKSENLFSDHRSVGHHGHLLSYSKEDLLPYHNS